MSLLNIYNKYNFAVVRVLFLLNMAKKDTVRNINFYYNVPRCAVSVYDTFTSRND